MGMVETAIRLLDGAPRPSTGGADGLYLFGWSGVFTGAASATCGIAVQRWTDSQVAGVVAGTLIGSALGAGAALALGHANLTAGLAGGALLGCFETLRGDQRATNRDANNLLSAFFVSGPAKMAAPLGSMIGAHCDTQLGKAAVSAVTGAALAAGLAMCFPTHPGLLATTLISGACGAVGPVFGARTSQLLRNAAQDAGRGLQSVAARLGYECEDAGPPSKLAQAAGTVPVAFMREGLRAFFVSGGSWQSVLVGGIKESIQQIQIVLTAKSEAPPPEAV